MDRTPNNEPLDYQTARERALLLVERLTSEEKLALIGGVRGFFIPAMESADIREVMMSDATAGLKLRDEWQGEPMERVLERSTAFPCPLQLAATWNTEMCARYAQAVGEECRAAGVGILLGPGVNIYRHAQCGRNFEYLGEDPYLASRMTGQYVQSLQSTGVVATLKHLIANNTDFYRRRSNSIVDERTLHEIYLPAFRAGVEAGARAVMTAYNLLNGEWCSQNRRLITEILRGELGYQWLVMTDWWAIYDTTKAVASGLDIEMPAREVLAHVQERIDQDDITMAQIDRMVERIVTTCVSMDLYDPDFQRDEFLERFEAHEDVALETACQGTVLLKNEGDLLPLSTERRILLTGRFTHDPAAGGGAAYVQGYNHTSLHQALSARFGSQLTYVTEPTDDQLRDADVVIVSTGTLDSEGHDRPFALPAEEERRVQRAVAANPHTVVVVGSGGGVRMTDWVDGAAAILYGWYGGQRGNEALARIITGEVNPSGKLPISIEREFADSPAANYLPAGEELYSGWDDEGEKVHPVYDLPYDEGLLVGYRWYDTKGIAPLFPFGHGLSYTSFHYDGIGVHVDEQDGTPRVHVTCTVKNTGSRWGREIVQLYVRPWHPSVTRPEKELKEFAGVCVEPGETHRVLFSLDASAFAYWDGSQRSWIAEEGTYEVLLGASSRAIHLRSSVKWPRAITYR